MKLALRKCISSLRTSGIPTWKHLPFKHKSHQFVNDSLVVFPQGTSTCQLSSLRYHLKDCRYTAGQLLSLQHPILLVPHLWSTAYLPPSQTLGVSFNGKTGQMGGLGTLVFVPIIQLGHS